MTGVRVLLVDDHDLWRDFLTSALEAFDEVDEVRTASTYLTAIETVGDFAADVVITDFRLGPDVRDGIAVCEAVQETRPTAKLIFLTGYATAEAVREAFSVGAAAVFDKATLRMEDLRVEMSRRGTSCVTHT